MASKGVVQLAYSKLRFKGTPLGCTNFSMMQANLLRECPSFPTLHSCGEDRNMIDSPRLHWHIPANLFKTLSPKELASTGDVFDTDETIVVHRAVFKGCTNQTEC